MACYLIRLLLTQCVSICIWGNLWMTLWLIIVISNTLSYFMYVAHHRYKYYSNITFHTVLAKRLDYLFPQFPCTLSQRYFIMIRVRFSPKKFSPKKFSPRHFSPDSSVRVNSVQDNSVLIQFSPKKFSPKKFSPWQFSPEAIQSPNNSVPNTIQSQKIQSQ